ncbi:MAG: D-glycero-beta-D-manno-heptose-7-phosphate kinase [Chlorobi bacterium]|nr:D-glycero-beta-D-manno-heptose-7-phosphate kinase [Chlorobiota bacterium]
MEADSIKSKVREILNKLDAFKDLKVLVIGDLILDIYEEGEVNRISPEAPIPIVRLKRTFYRLGGAGNVAQIANNLGADVTIAGVIGDDREGQVLIDLMEKSGIDTSGVIVSEDRPTTQKTRIISRGQQLLRIDREEDSSLPLKERENLLSALNTIFSEKTYDAIIIEDYDKGVLSEETINYLDSFRDIGSVDPKERNFWRYSNYAIFKPNLRELIHAINPNTSLDNAIQEAYNRLTPQWLVVTMGEEGIKYVTAEGEGHVPAFPIEVADVTGAGDAVIVALSLCKAIGCSVEEACLFANLTASLVCQRIGTFAPEPQDLVHHAKALGLID